MKIDNIEVELALNTEKLKEQLEGLKSCANCSGSVFNDIRFGDDPRIGFHVINGGCNNNGDKCLNYSAWEFDNLTSKERAGQEIK